MFSSHTHKADKPPPGVSPLAKRTRVNSKRVEDVIRGYTNAKKPAVIRSLATTWNEQQAAITFAEITQASKSGQVLPKWAANWFDDYSQVINEVFDPEWRAAQDSGAGYIVEEMAKNVGITVTMPEVALRLEEWISTRGGELIVGLSRDQTLAVRNLLNHYIVDLGVGPRQLEKVLRPVIGLTSREAGAVQKFTTGLTEAGLKPSTVTARSDRYAARLHKLRAERIARTEIASAHNRGSFEGMLQARDQGDISGAIAKRWWTALDERVCPWCGPLHGTVVGLEKDFTPFPIQGRQTIDFADATPPLHAQCRCGLIYEIWQVGVPTKPVVVPKPPSAVSPVLLPPPRIRNNAVEPDRWEPANKTSVSISRLKQHSFDEVIAEADQFADYSLSEIALLFDVIENELNRLRFEGLITGAKIKKLEFLNKPRASWTAQTDRVTEISLNTSAMRKPLKKLGDKAIGFDAAWGAKSGVVEFTLADSKIGGGLANIAMRHETGHVALHRAGTEAFKDFIDVYTKKIKKKRKVVREAVSDYAASRKKTTFLELEEFYAEVYAGVTDPKFKRGSLDKALGIEVEDLVLQIAKESK